MNKSKLLILICLIAFVVSEDCMDPCHADTVQCLPDGGGRYDCVCCNYTQPFCCKKAPEFLEQIQKLEEEFCKKALLKEYPLLKDIASDVSIEDVRGIIEIIKRVTVINPIVRDACAHKMHK